jgi:hypothetical protein
MSHIRQPRWLALHIPIPGTGDERSADHRKPLAWGGALSSPRDGGFWYQRLIVPELGLHWCGPPRNVGRPVDFPIWSGILPKRAEGMSLPPGRGNNPIGGSSAGNPAPQSPRGRAGRVVDLPPRAKQHPEGRGNINTCNGRSAIPEPLSPARGSVLFVYATIFGHGRCRPP